MLCPLCGEGPFRNLGQHFRWNHEIGLRDYLAQNPPACEHCGDPITYPDSRVHAAYILERRFCSNACNGAGMSGESHPNWQGGGWTREDGYRVVSVRGKAHLEHRLVMERELGRPLRSDEHMHHTNGVKDDNRPENLQIVSPEEHSRMHDHHVPWRRRARGSQHGSAKLSESDVLSIRDQHAGGETQVSLAAQYLVSHSPISRIVRREAWAHD